ncbi:MAG: type II secretion system protein [Planctomycetes bacterium]|nr:type II secretion system protein [Planctomycetota bacterium]
MTRRLDRRLGFTMVELLVALTLLSAIGALLLQLVRGSFMLYRDGDQRGDLYSTAIPVLEMLEDDLRAVDPGPDGRLLVLPSVFGNAGEGIFIRLVRSMPGGEQQHGVLRRAGTSVGAGGTYSGRDPGLEERSQIAPPSGLIEVAYALVQEPEDPVGVLTLYRGERAPAHGSGSFFASPGSDEGWVRKNLQPVATGILGLWLLCQGQETEDWQEEIVLEGAGGQGASLMTWDSTRGMLSSEKFPLARGGASLADPRDDVYPRALRIVLHVARGQRPEATLRRVLRADRKTIDVNTTEQFPGEENVVDRYVKVGSEWMLVGQHQNGEAVVERRCRRSGSRKTVHRIGEPVFVGRVFRKTLALPAARSWWSGEDR